MSKKKEKKNKIKRDMEEEEEIKNIKEIWKRYEDFLIGLGLAALVLIIHLPHLKDVSIWIDGYGYLFGAWWFSHHPFSFTLRLMKTQAYIPMLVIAFFQKLYNPYFAARLMNFTYAVAGAVIMYFLGKEIKNRETGIIASLFYSTIPILYFLGNRSLVDLPLSVMYALTSLFLIKMEKTKELRWYILSGIALGSTLITKSAGSVLYGIIATYLLLTRKQKVFKERGVWYLAIGAIAVPLPIIIMNLVHFHKPLVAPNAFSSIVFKAPSYFTYLSTSFLSQYFPLYLIPFSLLGMLFLYKTKNKKDIALYLSIYFILYFVMFSILKYQEPRFMSPLAVVISLTAAYFFTSIKARSVLEKGVVWLFVLFISYAMFSSGETLTQAKAWTHSGFMELEQYINEHVENNSYMHVGSIWMMHFVTRHVYDDPTKHTKILRKNETQEKESLEECKEQYDKCYVEIDLWEWTQPAYVQYFSQLNTYLSTGNVESMPIIKDLENKLNLKLLDVVIKPYYTPQQVINVPVVMFFEYKR